MGKGVERVDDKGQRGKGEQSIWQGGTIIGKLKGN